MNSKLCSGSVMGRGEALEAKQHASDQIRLRIASRLYANLAPIGCAEFGFF
jgi:hypothetical protein